jgi:hypothetical protein
MQKMLDTVYVEPDLYRFKIHKAYVKNSMDLLRYLTSPKALEARNTNKLNTADIIVLLDMNDETITQNLLTSAKTKEFTQKYLSDIPEGSPENP